MIPKWYLAALKAFSLTKYENPLVKSSVDMTPKSLRRPNRFE